MTIVEALPRLLGREEPFAATFVQDALVARGVTVRTGERAVAVSRAAAGVSVRLESGEEFLADELLVAVGRRPASRELGLELLGLEPGRSVEVDEQLLVPGTDWLYAIGDVNGRALLTHMGKYQARIAADVILGREAKLDEHAGGALFPRVVFTDPQVAAVGHTLESALAEGLPVSAVDHETSGTAGGQLLRAGGCRQLASRHRRGATCRCGGDLLWRGGL